ncbi:circadian clock-controlled protein daywake-like [Cydia splendana]|uniref:circadian clock-controlled protein daywake-like n=1 Tax=Cydia splendana TaxID=1100963 RepID=UPI00300BFC24
MLAKSVLLVLGGNSTEGSVVCPIFKMFVKSLVVLAFVGLVSSSAVPLTKCKIDDTKCIKQNTEVLIPLFSAGIPDLGIEQLDPVSFKKIDSSSDVLRLIFKDATLKGLSTCRFKSVKRDASKLNAKIHCDVSLDGKYDMKGQILGLPINGDGNMHIEHEKVEITFELSYKEETGADGKKHWITGAWTHTFAYKGKTKLEFDNLFGGNEILGRAARELMKTSANDIATITAGPVIKTITARILKNVKIFFEKVPVEDFVLE